MLKWLLFPLLLLGASAAQASAEVAYGPAPAWVDPIAIPASDPKAPPAPVQLLLVDAETRFDPAGDEFYVETATKVMNAQGLQAAGSLIIPWHAGTRALTVHKVHIVRDGKVIDVLADGQRFTAIRRESNLEMAMMDGVMTAVMQPEGLEVGDIVDVSFTLRVVPGSVPFKSENLIALPPGMAAVVYRARQLWPSSLAMEWRGRGLLKDARLKERNGVRELSVKLAGLRVPEPPSGAPGRFALGATLQTSAYTSWEDVSAMLAPLYAEASTLGEGSPLAAEARKIAAASGDPVARALAALRLVQDRVRYVAIGMNEGGYLPVKADETWARRFGDCKAKTAMLLALLRALDIPAEPVIVSTVNSDALGELLPNASAFDHVLVRARVAGRTLWLDGTLAGQRNPEDLIETPFRRGLALTTPGSPLETFPIVPPSRPYTQWTRRIDASGGIDLPAPTRIEYRFRGQDAFRYQLWLSTQTPDQVEKALRDYWKGFDSVLAVESVDHRYDDATMTMVLTATGKTTMGWYDNPQGTARRFELASDVIDWPMKFERDDPIGRDAPFAIPFPVFATSSETVILPLDGKGFEIVGESTDATVAGAEIKRTISLSGDTVTSASSFRTTRTELAAEAAKAALPAIEKINESAAYIQAPPSYESTKQEREAAIHSEPTTADDYVTRGLAFSDRGEQDKAIADFERAIALDPNDSYAYANRGIVRFWQGDIDTARADFDRALALRPDNEIGLNGRGLLLELEGKLGEAIAAFSKAFDARPLNQFALTQRAQLRFRTGDEAGAIADMDRLLTLSPDHPGYLYVRAEMLTAAGERQRALADMDRLIALDPEGYAAHGFKAAGLRRLGDAAAADAEFARAIAVVDALIAETPEVTQYRIARASLIKERGDRAGAIAALDRLIAKDRYNKYALNNRCWTRATAGDGLEQALADCDAAVKEDDGFLAALDSRALVKLRMGRFRDAIADYDRALAEAPFMAASRYGRGLAKLKTGDAAGARADINAAEMSNWLIARQFADMGLSAE